MPFSRAYPTIIDSSYVTHYSKNMKVETPKRKYKFKSELEVLIFIHKLDILSNSIISGIIFNRK